MVATRTKMGLSPWFIEASGATNQNSWSIWENPAAEMINNKMER
jgi:hypothetical protein